uniref:Uncharacterized protein n=1 Tax=Cacopsylla melanoneura TaxID=428564 RepID=A0A8D8WST8_9HEMI
MDTKNDADSLDNALKIMNNLFQLTEEFVNDTPDDGNQNQPNASTLSSSTSSKPNDSSAPGLTFPKLPDPDTFFESIVTNSKTTLESSTNVSPTISLSAPVSTCNKTSSSSSTIKVGPVLYPKAASFDSTPKNPPLLGPTIPPLPVAGSSQFVSNVHPSNLTGQAVTTSNQRTGHTNQPVVKTVDTSEKGIVKNTTTDTTPFGNLQSEIEKVVKKSELNAIFKYSTYSDDVQMLINKHLEPKPFVNNMLEKNNMIVSFINKIKTSGGGEEASSKESSSNNESSSSKESSSSNKETTSTATSSSMIDIISGAEDKTSGITSMWKMSAVSKKVQKQSKPPVQKQTTISRGAKKKNVAKNIETDLKTDPSNETNSKTAKRSQPTLEGEVMLTTNQVKAIQKQPTINGKLGLLKDFIRFHQSSNTKRLIKVNINSLLHDEVELITKAKEVLKKGKRIGDTQACKDATEINEISKNATKINQKETQASKECKNATEIIENKTESTRDEIETKRDKNNPVDTQSNTTEAENANTEQNKESGLLGDKNNDNTSSKHDITETNSELIDASTDESTISDEATHVMDDEANEHTFDEKPSKQIGRDEADEIVVLEVPGSNISEKDTHVMDDKANEKPIDEKPSKQIEDDEIIVLEVPEKVFPLIDILSDDEDITNNMQTQDRNTDQESDVMEISVDNELKQSIDEAGGVAIEELETDENSEYKQLALETHVSNMEEGTNMNEHLERNIKRDYQLETLNPLKNKKAADNKVKDHPNDNNKVSDESNANSLKRKNEKDDSLNEIEGKKRRDTSETIIKNTQHVGVEIDRKTTERLEGQEIEEINQRVEGNQEAAEDVGHLMSDQTRIQDSAILNLINEVKMSTRQQRKQDSATSLENPPSKPSIRDRLGDKLSIKDRIGPIDSSSSSSRGPIGGSRIRDRLGGKVVEEDDREGGGGLAIRIQIENELVTSGGAEMDLAMSSATSLRHDSVLDDDVPFIRQVLIEPANNASTENDPVTTDEETHPRYLSPNDLDNSTQPEDVFPRMNEDNFPRMNEDDFPGMNDEDCPMFNEAGDGTGDGFQTLSEAESEDRGGSGSDGGRKRKRRSVKERLGRRVDSSEDEEDRRSPPSRHHHLHRRYSGSSRSRSPGYRDRDSRPYAHVSRHKLVRDRSTRRDSSPSRRDKSRDSRSSRRDSPSSRREDSLERRRKSLERREKSLERREKERKERHGEEESRSKVTRAPKRSKYKWSRTDGGKSVTTRGKKPSKFKWSRPHQADADKKEVGREIGDVTSRSKDNVVDNLSRYNMMLVLYY